MTSLSPDYFKRFLLSIYPCKTDFEVILTHQKPKTRMGTYTPKLKRIRIYDGWGDDKLCKMIAIHEYAHHLNHTEAMQDERQNKPHGHEFWQIYGMLLVKAKERNLYHDEIMSAFAIS